MIGAEAVTRWYAERASWRVIGLGYLPWLVALNLAWEIAQLPFYTLWTVGSPEFIAFSVVHCTLGDAIIGVTALALALLITRAAELARWRWGRIAAVTALFGAAYTIFSEWTNTAQLHWEYSELMPVVRAFGIEIGLSPLAQWLLLPPLALWLVLRTIKGERT